MWRAKNQKNQFLFGGGLGAFIVVALPWLTGSAPPAAAAPQPCDYLTVPLLWSAVYTSSMQHVWRAADLVYLDWGRLVDGWINVRSIELVT